MITKKITGIILAGGKSSRMGSDKGILELNGKKFIEHIIAALSPNVDQIIIIANNDNYNNFGCKVFKDLITDCGPLGGMYTGLTASSTEKNMVVSCDIPFITSELINHIIDHSDDSEITIPVYNGNIEPLCGVYSKTMAKNIHSLLLNNELKMHNVLTCFNTKYIPILPSEKLYSNKLLLNINTPGELILQKQTNL